MHSGGIADASVCDRLVIDAIQLGIAMADRRQYVQLYHSFLVHVKGGLKYSTAKRIGGRSRLTRLFTANMSKIGLLGPHVAAKIAKYHSISWVFGKTRRAEDFELARSS